MLVGVVLAVLAVLVANAHAALFYSGVHLLTSDRWDPKSLHPSYGLLGVLTGSLVIAAVALGIAIPVSVGTALALTEYLPHTLRRPLISLIDLLAALPSLVFGLWGLRVLSTEVFGTTVWLSHHADFIRIFQVPDGTYGNSLFVCGLVVSVMVTPIITSITREVMAQVPRDQCDAALALGGTRWSVATEVILPFSRAGILGASLLGLGRAMGETIAVLLILAGNNTLWSHLLTPGGGSTSALIAQQFTSLPSRGQSALSAAGLILFTAILIINFAARAMVARGHPVAR